MYIFMHGNLQSCCYDSTVLRVENGNLKLTRRSGKKRKIQKKFEFYFSQLN